LVDENTIGICAIVGTTYTGEYEDVKAMNDLLIEKDIDCPIHGKDKVARITSKVSNTVV
jgi:glutamate decarboxylase